MQRLDGRFSEKAPSMLLNPPFPQILSSLSLSCDRRSPQNMPVPGIGSVGDIIAVAELALKIAKALKDNGGSAYEYRDIIRGLLGIEKPLIELNILCRSLDRTTTYSQLADSIKQEVEDCRMLVEECRKRIEKFDRALREGGSGNKMKDVYHRIQWRISQKDFVLEFTQRLQTRVQAIDLLTTILQLVKTDISDEKFYRRLDEIGTKIAGTHYDTLLSSLKDEVGRNNKMIERQTHFLRWLTLPNLQKFGSDLFDKLRIIGILGQDTLHEVKWISSYLQISRPHYPMFERTALLDDAFGLTVPIPIDFVTSWVSFDTLLSNRFTEFPAAKLVKQQDYILEDADSSQRFDRWLPWEAVFRPGRKLKMSMVLNSPTKSGSACPSCAVEDSGTTDKHIEWHVHSNNYAQCNSDAITALHVACSIEGPRKSLTYRRGQLLKMNQKRSLKIAI